MAVARTGRARVIDIAREAGVSIATVDRVLNNRASVRSMTAERVWEAAERLRTGTAVGDGTRPRATGLSFDFILPAGAGPSMEDLRRQIDSAGTRHGVTTRCQTIERMNPGAMAEALIAAVDSASNGIGFHALEHPLVREAVAQAAARGVASLAMLSDLSGSATIGYVGTDNRAAGRTAGYLMGRFLRGCRGHVATFAGSALYRSHEEREMGFRTVVRDGFADLQMLDLVVGQDAPEANYKRTLELLDRYRDLIGIYNVGSGNRGIVRALRERAGAADVTFIGHNLSATSREYLLDGTMDAVIHQDLAGEADLAIQMLLDQRRLGKTAPARLPVEIFVRENIID